MVLRDETVNEQAQTFLSRRKYVRKRPDKKRKPRLSLDVPRYRVGAEIVGPVTAPPLRYKKSAAVQKQLFITAEDLFARWGYAAVSNPAM